MKAARTIGEPPKPPELAMRIAGDAGSRVDVDRERLVAAVVERLAVSEGDDALMAADEIAAEVVAEVWDGEGLADAFAAALADVQEQCLTQAIRVREAIDELDGHGRESWAGRALAHQLASDTAWTALERLDLLERWPADALCAMCGELVERPPE